ncbi:MAG TPA: MarR family winged helix-turn-helix transcriptional regulator [Candidatus Nanopelagicaceae bacterium]|nr:MarR family winged helix-turn-helix transcriptional regulator [Candidatus Nanopelagicaceae bacterium]
MSDNNIKCEDKDCVVFDFSEIYKLINRINKKFEKLQRRIIQKENLTTAQYSILQQLWKTDGVQFKTLANACCCSQSTITGIVDTMEKKDIVVRKMNPEDRRSVLVILTDKGKTLEKETPNVSAMLDNCCSGFNPNDIEDLTKMLKKLDSSLIIAEPDSC